MLTLGEIQIYTLKLFLYYYTLSNGNYLVVNNSFAFVLFQPPFTSYFYWTVHHLDS